MTERSSADAEFLLRNAVEALPEGELESKLGLGRPLRVKLGIAHQTVGDPPRASARPAVSGAS